MLYIPIILFILVLLLLLATYAQIKDNRQELATALRQNREELSKKRSKTTAMNSF